MIIAVRVYIIAKDLAPLLCVLCVGNINLGVNVTEMQHNFQKVHAQGG